MPKVYIKTFGCQMNLRDSEVVAGLLEKSGYKLTDTPEKAYIVIFNTCSVRQHAEDKVWSEIGRFAKLKTKPLIGLIGCMAQNYKAGVFQRAPAVDFAVGPADIDKIPEIIKQVTGGSRQGAGGKLYQRKIWETEGRLRPEEIYHTGFHQDKKHAYVVISEGCVNFCSYCVVPYTRGPLRHRKPADIVREIETAVKKGITKITLLGQNVNAYNCGGVNFVNLVNCVNLVKGLKEFSFITSHPKDTSVELFQAMASADKLKKYLHLPIQSGSDRMLKLMNRGYTVKYYLDLADKYRKIVKPGQLTTDIIVGFPGETQNDFQDTYDLVKKVKFDSGFIFKYSPRPNTAALKYKDDVSKEEKERRHQLILNLQKKISKKHAKDKS